ncbi:MAG: hypothetical protein LBS46_02300 [Dysgonamonadaceae bacterium]|nr:hypothetical protein [Dysgonamonadaceae bacterium]
MPYLCMRKTLSAGSKNANVRGFRRERSRSGTGTFPFSNGNVRDQVSGTFPLKVGNVPV